MNVYLIEDEPLMLVDTGPTPGPLDALERALAARGHALADLELVVLTHQHVDHLGLVDVIRRRSRAEVAASEPCGPSSLDADDAFTVEVMRRHGVPSETARALQALGAHTVVDRVLDDGDRIELAGRTPAFCTSGGPRRSTGSSPSGRVARTSSRPPMGR